jgi:hypothetical protein
MAADMQKETGRHARPIDGLQSQVIGGAALAQMKQEREVTWYYSLLIMTCYNLLTVQIICRAIVMGSAYC